MTPIKNIVNDVASSERLKQQERVSSSTRSEKSNKPGKASEGAAVEPRKDTVAISDTARQLAESRNADMVRYQEMLGTLKEGDGEKAERIQQRITEGAYNEPAVLEKVAEAIGNLPQFRSLSESSPEAPGGREITGDIATRIRSGRYDSEEVLERVAMNILRDIGAA